MDTTFFFGYGLLSDRSIIREIIGRDPGAGRTAIVEGYQLTYQVLSQIPKNIRDTLEHAWGKEFRAYTLRQGTGVVAGIVWEFTKEDLEKIRAWEFVGSWRESLTATAKTNDGEMISVNITKVPDTQPFEEIVNGLKYEVNLNSKIKRTKEGNLQDEELLSQVRLQLRELAAQGRYGKQALA